MMKTILSVVVIFATAIGLSFAYADEFKMPFNPDKLIDHWVDVVFIPTEDGGVDVKVTHTSLFHYNKTIEMPDNFQIQVVDLNGGIYSSETIVVRQIYENIISPTIEPEPEEPKLSPEQQARIDEKIAKREAIAKEALTCGLE